MRERLRCRLLGKYGFGPTLQYLRCTHWSVSKSSWNFAEILLLTGWGCTNKSLRNERISKSILGQSFKTTYNQRKLTTLRPTSSTKNRIHPKYWSAISKHIPFGKGNYRRCSKALTLKFCLGKGVNQTSLSTKVLDLRRNYLLDTTKLPLTRFYFLHGYLDEEIYRR